MPGGPGDGQRTLASCQELGVEQQERQPAEMIAVQMRQDDAVDPQRIDALRLQRHQCGSAAIDQQGAARALQQEAGVEPAAGAEGISDPTIVTRMSTTSGLRARPRGDVRVPALHIRQVVRNRELGGLHEVDRDHPGDVRHRIVCGRPRKAGPASSRSSTRRKSRCAACWPRPRPGPAAPPSPSWPDGSCGTRARPPARR